MKNRMIREAWDTVTPTQRQKDRMRAALEAHMEASGKSVKQSGKIRQLPQEEPLYLDFALPEDPYAIKPQEKAPQKTGKQKKAREHSSRGQRKSNTALQIAAAAALMVLAIGGGLFMGIVSGRGKETPYYEAPPTTETTAPTQEQEGDMPQEYKTLLDKYKTAIAERWDGGRCGQEEISILVRDVSSADGLGYALQDLNGDGTPELLITDGNVIYDLYAIFQGKTLRLLTGYERIAYYLCKDNVIGYVGSSSAAVTQYQFFAYEGRETLRPMETVNFDAEKNPDSPWFGGDGETPITEQEAQEIIDAYPHLVISFTPLSQWQEDGELEVDEALMKRYAESIPQALRDYSKSEEKTFCFYDSDGDGKDELLLGAGDSVYRILQPLTGSEDFIDIAAPTGEQGYAFLCQGNVFESIANAQGMYYYEYNRIGDANGNMSTEKIEFLSFDLETDTWYGGSADMPVITQAEAEAIRGKYPRVELDWKGLSQFPVPIPEAEDDATQSTRLFEKVFMPVATGEIGKTQEEIEKLLEDNGFIGEKVDDMIVCYDQEAQAGSHLAGVLSVVNGRDEVIDWRYVRFEGEIKKKAMIVTGGKGFYLDVEDQYEGMYVDTPEGLREFITNPKSVPFLEIQAKSFAYAYFQGNWDYLRKNVVSGYGDVEIYTGEDGWNAYVGMVKGIDAEAAANGEAYVSVECRVPPESDSYSYLTMEFVFESGAWKVKSYGLEK